MSPDPEQLARFARVEPPAELDAWVRSRLRAAVAEHSPAAASAAVPRSEPSCGASPEPSRAVPSRWVPARSPASVPLVERLALTVGAVACGVQASSLVLRMVWSVLTLGR